MSTPIPAATWYSVPIARLVRSIAVAEPIWRHSQVTAPLAAAANACAIESNTPPAIALPTPPIA